MNNGVRTIEESSSYDIHERSWNDQLCRKLVIAVTGSVGAAAVLPSFLLLSRRLFAREHRVVLSRASLRFLSAYVVRLYSGHQPVTDLFDASEWTVPHLQVTKGAELLVVMPATANIIGKVANGIADDIVSTTILSAHCPVVFVPNMNEVMWRKAPVMRNVATLRRDGYHIIEPGRGIEVSDMSVVEGVMPEPRAVLKALVEILIQSRTNEGGHYSPREV